MMANQVVGVSLDGGGRFRAFVWTATGGMENLNALVDPDSGWVLADAVGVNESGQIVGSGRYMDKSVAYRLDPIWPRLRIELEGTNVVVSWAPPWPDYVLERTTALSPPSWSAIPGATNSPVRLPAAEPALFFRLRK